VVAYLMDDLDAGKRAAALAALQGIDGALRTAIVTPEAAMAEFVARGPSFAALVDGLDANILPTSVNLWGRDWQRIAARARATPGVADVDADDVAARAHAQSLVHRGLVALLGLLTFTLVFVTYVVVSMALAERVAELEVLRLVGATDAYILHPVVVRFGTLGALAGGAAGLSLRLVSAYDIPADLPHAAAVLATLGAVCAGGTSAICGRALLRRRSV
jgi:cell division transport system permease protein